MAYAKVFSDDRVPPGHELVRTAARMRPRPDAWTCGCRGPPATTPTRFVLWQHEVAGVPATGLLTGPASPAARRAPRRRAGEPPHVGSGTGPPAHRGRPAAAGRAVRRRGQPAGARSSGRGSCGCSTRWAADAAPERRAGGPGARFAGPGAVAGGRGVRLPASWTSTGSRGRSRSTTSPASSWRSRRSAAACSRLRSPTAFLAGYEAVGRSGRPGLAATPLHAAPDRQGGRGPPGRCARTATAGPAGSWPRPSGRRRSRSARPRRRGGDRAAHRPRRPGLARSRRCDATTGRSGCRPPRPGWTCSTYASGIRTCPTRRGAVAGPASGSTTRSSCRSASGAEPAGEPTRAAVPRVWRFPDDPDLPALATLTDPAGPARCSREGWPPITWSRTSGSCGGSPGRARTVRCILAGPSGRRVVYAKVLGGGRHRRGRAVQRRLFTRAAGGPAGGRAARRRSGADGILWTGEVVGRPLLTALATSRGRRAAAGPVRSRRCPALRRSDLPGRYVDPADRRGRGRQEGAQDRGRPAAARPGRRAAGGAGRRPARRHAVRRRPAAARRLPRRPDAAHRARSGAARPRRDGDGRPGARPRRARRRPRPAAAPGSRPRGRFLRSRGGVLRAPEGALPHPAALRGYAAAELLNRCYRHLRRPVPGWEAALAADLAAAGRGAGRRSNS